MCVCAKSFQSCLTLCNPMDHNLPGSSVHGILQARILEWVAWPSSRGSSHLGIKPRSLTFPALAGEFFTISTTSKDHITCTCVYKCIKNIFMFVPLAHLYNHVFNWMYVCSFPLSFYMHKQVCQGWFVTLVYPSLPHLFQLPCNNVWVHPVSPLTSVPLLLGIHCHLLPDVENLTPYFLPDLSSSVHNCYPFQLNP